MGNQVDILYRFIESNPQGVVLKCLAARLLGCSAAWMPGCLASWLPG